MTNIKDSFKATPELDILNELVKGVTNALPELLQEGTVIREGVKTPIKSVKKSKPKSRRR